MLGGALVDDALTKALLSRWRSDGNGRTTKAREAFIREGGGALTFGLKIDLAYLTHLVGSEVHANLVTIKDIRNRFA